MFAHKLAGLNAFYQVIKANRIATLIFAALIFALSTVASHLISKATERLIPALDESAQIIKNQNMQFDVVKENLQKLQNSVNKQDREYLDSAFAAVKDIKNTSGELALKIAALQDENNQLEQTLKSTKGIYGGVDVVVPNNSGFKIDSQNSFGFRIRSTYAIVSLTSTNTLENVREKGLRSGQGIEFTNENSKKCALVYNGNTQISAQNSNQNLVAGNFQIICKK